MVIHIEIGMDGCYNLRNPAVKRLMKEAEELRNSTEEYYAQPVEGNLFEWHFTVRGPSNTDFDGGVYHGRITLPPEYPMKPPSIILLTPNGRFEVNKKICLSISGHHPESWRPSWSIRTALLAIIGFMPTHGNGAIGSLDYSPEERQTLAKRSLNWECPECGIIESLLEKRTSGSSSSEASNEALQLMSMISFKGEEEKEVKRDSSISKGLEIDRPLPIDLSSEESVKSSDDNKIEIQKVIIKSTENHNLVPDPSTLETVTRQRLPFSQMSLENSSYTVPQVEHFEEVENIHATSGVLSSRTWSTPLMWVLAFLIALLLLRRLFFLY